MFGLKTMNWLGLMGRYQRLLDRMPRSKLQMGSRCIKCLKLFLFYSLSFCSIAVHVVEGSEVINFTYILMLCSSVIMLGFAFEGLVLHVLKFRKILVLSIFCPTKLAMHVSIAKTNDLN